MPPRRSRDERPNGPLEARERCRPRGNQDRCESFEPDRPDAAFPGGLAETGSWGPAWCHRILDLARGVCRREFGYHRVKFIWLRQAFACWAGGKLLRHPGGAMADSQLEVADKNKEKVEDALPGAEAIRKNLVFFLGLVPLAVAAMRVYLMGQGDGVTMLALAQTLDVRAVVVGTFARPIGVMGTAAALYIFCRAYWPRIRSWHSEWAASRLGVLLLVLLVSLGCLYPEEVLDWTNPSPGPVDVARALGWVLAGQAACWLGFEVLQRVVDRYSDAGLRGPRRLLHDAADRGAAFCNAVLRLCTSSRPEVYLLVPAILLVFWVYLITDRMWLPAQVVELSSAPACVNQDRGACPVPMSTR